MLSKTLTASLVAAALWATANPDTAMARDAHPAPFGGLVAGFQFYSSDPYAYVVSDMDGFLRIPAYAQGVGPTLTIGAASAPDAQYQVRAIYLNSSSTNQIPKGVVRDVSGADLMKGIDITNSGFDTGRYDIYVYGNCGGDSCTTGNLMASKLVTLEMVDPNNFHVVNFNLANRKLDLVVQDPSLRPTAHGQSISVSIADSTGKVVSQQLVSQDVLAGGVAIGTSTYPAGDYTVHAKGPCVASVRGSYDCSGATYDVSAPVFH